MISSCGQFGFDLVHDASKSGLVVHSDIRQHLTVDFDSRLLQSIGELAVGQTAFTRGGVDTGNRCSAAMISPTTILENGGATG